MLVQGTNAIRTNSQAPLQIILTYLKNHPQNFDSDIAKKYWGKREPDLLSKLLHSIWGTRNFINQNDSFMCATFSFVHMSKDDLHSCPFMFSLYIYTDSFIFETFSSPFRHRSVQNVNDSHRQSRLQNVHGQYGTERWRKLLKNERITVSWKQNKIYFELTCSKIQLKI